MTADELLPGTIPYNAVRALRKLGLCEELSTAELAEAVGQSSSVMLPALQTVRNHGIVYARKHPGGNGLWWSMGTGEPLLRDTDDDEPPKRPSTTSVPPLTARSVFDIARGASDEPDSPARDSQQVLKAEAATPDATDSDVSATTGPGVGPMGAGQAADAAPAAGQAPQLRFALWSDGALQIQRAGNDCVVLARSETEALFDYLDGMRREVEA